MLAYRVIARLDIKGPHLIKGICFEGLRKLGDPATFAKRYADDGADEIIYLDTVASLYGRDNILRIVEETSDRVFVPITVGGGVRSLGDVRSLLRAGADKVAINTAAVADPSLIARIADSVGSQAVVASIECKRRESADGPVWEAYTDQGRNRTGRDAVKWAEEAARLGAGEILLTSIDRDGTMRGPDAELAQAVRVTVPVVLAGGIGKPEHACGIKSSAVAVGAALHYGKTKINDIKAALAASGRVVREQLPSDGWDWQLRAGGSQGASG